MALDSSGALLTNTASSVSGRRVGTAGADERDRLVALVWPNRSRLVNAAKVGAGGSARDSAVNAAGDCTARLESAPPPTIIRMVLAIT